MLGAAAVALLCAVPMTAMASERVVGHKGTTVVHTESVKENSGTTKNVNIKERIKAILNSQNKPAKKPWVKPSNVMHELPMVSKDEGGTLLFSDSPEYVEQNGILYQDTVSGDVRVLYYHLNNTSEPKKIAVVLENKYEGTNVIHITRGGSGAPSANYMKVGKAVQMQYFGQPMDQKIVLGEGVAKLLQEDMNTILLQPGQLVSGMYDFYADHPVKVSVLMLDAYGDPVTESRNLPILPKDAMRLRGTYTGMNRVMTSAREYHPETDGIMYFPLADDKRDKYREGIDATDGSAVKDEGNYGIVYRIQVPTAGDCKVQYYLCPLGGVYAGAVRMKYGEIGPDMLPTPQGQIYFGDNTPTETQEQEELREKGIVVLTKSAELADLGVYRADKSVWIEYSPPGASNLPVSIIMVPVQ
ncbi:copper amine oxidase [Selenomonas ruminis]|uniref:Copper amine oxidase n=2 Tax=Selenomonas ruminis TaxID=2593411 RepID=A0A5D6VYJ8_9FIRM|nr:copper amine oxidase [Selenomonas sp.]TYZ19969.1 copper amine oxidase [Selenomonas sp. mPRGC5]